MATELNVSKLISSFGFEVDVVSLKRAQKVVADFKDSLRSIEAKIAVKSDSSAVRRVKDTAKKQTQILHDAHVAVLKKKHKLEDESDRLRRKLLKDSVTKSANDEVNIRKKVLRRAKGRVFRTQSSDLSSIVNESTGVNRSRELGNLRAFYANEERSTAEREAFREQAKLQKRMDSMHSQAIKENIALDRKRHSESARLARENAQRELEQLRIHRQALRENAKIDADRLRVHGQALRDNLKIERQKVETFRNQIKNLNDSIRLTRNVNTQERIQLEFDREQLIAQNKLNSGLITQAEHEERINRIIARRDELLRRAAMSSGGGMVGAGVGSRIAEGAGAAGLLSGGRKFVQGFAPSLAAGGAAFGSVMAVQTLFGQAQNIEKFRLALTAIEGDADKAEFELEHFRKTALETNVSLDSGLESYRKFFVSMRSAGQEADLTREVFDTMAQTSSILGISQDDTNGILRAFSQIAGKGKVQAEELTQQLGDRMPGALGLVADGLKITTEELFKQMEAGELTSSKFFPAMIEVMQRFSDNAGDVSQTLPGLWDATLDAMKDVSFQLDKLGFNDSLKVIIGNIKDFVEGAMPVISRAIMAFTVVIEHVSNVIGTRAGGMVASLLLAGFAIKKLMALFLGVRAIRTFATALVLTGTAGGTAAVGVGLLEAALIGVKSLMLWISRFAAVIFAPFFAVAAAIDTIEGFVTGKVSVAEQAIQFVGGKLGADDDFGANVIQSLRNALFMGDPKNAQTAMEMSNGSVNTNNPVINIKSEVNVSGAENASETARAVKGVNDSLWDQIQHGYQSMPGGFR